jgi:hypothetical protein
MPIPSYIQGSDADDVMRETLESDDSGLVGNVGVATEKERTGPWKEAFHFDPGRLGG